MPSNSSLSQLLRIFSSCMALSQKVSFFLRQCTSVLRHLLSGNVSHTFLCHESSPFELVPQSSAFVSCTMRPKSFELISGRKVLNLFLSFNRTPRITLFTIGNRIPGGRATLRPKQRQIAPQRGGKSHQGEGQKEGGRGGGATKPFLVNHLVMEQAHQQPQSHRGAIGGHQCKVPPPVSVAGQTCWLVHNVIWRTALHVLPYHNSKMRRFEMFEGMLNSVTDPHG